MVNFIKMRQKGGPAAGPASSGHSTSNGATRNMVGERHVHFESTPDIQTMGSETAGKTLLSRLFCVCVCGGGGGGGMGSFFITWHVTVEMKIICNWY